jgi:hypothetical protein
VSTFREFVADVPIEVQEPRVTPIREQTELKAGRAALSVHEEQIHALVQQLFFRHEPEPVHHVAFAPIEASTSTASLCFDVARALSQEDGCDVGLIDANPDSALLQTELQIATPSHALGTWPIAPHLWMVPRQSWLRYGCGQRITEQNLSRLRELTSEFDFSILWCAPVSWLTASVGQTCDGLVLVLTANRTRRLVAAQIKDQLGKAKVPLLGTVLAERRFPVPQGLYRNL